jgi:L-fuconolactonase
LIVDTHTHVVADDHSQFPLRPPGIAGIGNWFREAPVTVEGLLSEMDGAGVDRAVLVQAFSAYGSDNSYVTSAARAHPKESVSVCIVDIDRDAPARLRTLAEDDGTSGVRMFAIGNPTLVRLDDPAAAPVWEVARELGLRIVVTILAPQLPELRAVLVRYADLPIVLDHCGFPDLSGGAPFDRAAALFELAAFPNLHLKVSSHLLETAEAVGDPRDLVDRLVGAFGPERLMWGSDYPQTHDRPYGALVELGRVACSRRSANEQRAFLGENALRMWPELN